MEYFKICDKSHELAEEIMASDDFRRLKELKNLIIKECPYLLSRFNEAKDNFDKASQYGQYYKEYEKARTTLLEAKEALYNNPLVKEYKTIELRLQLELNKMAKELVSLVKGK